MNIQVVADVACGENDRSAVSGSLTERKAGPVDRVVFGLQKFVAKILLFSWVGSFDVLQTLNGHFIITSVYIIKILMTNSTSLSHEHTSAHDALSI